MRKTIRAQGARIGVLAVVLLAAVFVAAASAATVTNGDFETGDLTGWTTFTTANGTIGTPAVVSFDTTGSGASDAAQFQVGEGLSYTGRPEGGGIYQVVTTGAGVFSLSADAAVHVLGSNASCGVFELLVDGNVVASHDSGGYDIETNTGDCRQGHVLRFTLSAPGLVLSAGSHEIRILITRTTFGTPATPRQYVDNVALTQLTTSDQCKKGGWQSYGVFKNQGDCVSFLATGGKNQPANSG